MYKYQYEEFIKDIDKFYELSKDYNPDVILAVARGGVTFGHFLAERFKIRDLYTLNSIHYDGQNRLNSLKIFNLPQLNKDKKILVLDDIVDSGDSMYKIMSILTQKYPNTSFKTGSIFYKKSAKYNPDFKLKEANDWIDFFWSYE